MFPSVVQYVFLDFLERCGYFLPFPVDVWSSVSDTSLVHVRYSDLPVEPPPALVGQTKIVIMTFLCRPFEQKVCFDRHKDLTLAITLSFLNIYSSNFLIILLTTTRQQIVFCQGNICQSIAPF